MKVKAIAILTAIIIIVSYVPVYAGTTIPDPPYGSYDYWVVTDTYGEIRLYTSPNPIRVDYDNAGDLVLNIRSYKRYVLSGGYWSYDKENYNSVNASFNIIYASNHDIAYKDGSGFFFTPPKVSELCQIVRQAKTRGDFGIILRTISAGLIPVLGCLILAISFRKGWAFLQGQLRH